ncbi:MAG: EAL domain-containing protein [Sulfuricurvum sp.]
MYNINKNILRLIPVLFALIFIAKITYSFLETKDRQYSFAQKEAEVLNSYIVENRNYYRTLFVEGLLSLDEKTLSALPAFSARPISEMFSSKNPLNISVQTVSDNPRSHTNQADSYELEAIEYFRQNPKQSEYFSDKNSDFYQYASVLRIEQECLKCHGKKEDAPLFIQNAYDKAYDYNLDDVRGVVSIKIPKANLKRYFYTTFTKSIFFDLLILSVLFAGVAYVLKHSKNLNEKLKKSIEKKTSDLKHAFMHDNLTALPNRLQLIEDLKVSQNEPSRHLALLNIDSFKNINDIYGYDIGDRVIIEVAQRLKEFCNEKGFLYKLPSDEFAIFTKESITQEQFVELTQTLLAHLQEEVYSIDDERLFISFGCGIVSNQSQLLIKASTALKLAKSSSKSIVVYDTSLDSKEQSSKNLDTLMILKDAIANDRIYPYYQAIYNTKTKRVEKYEALVRLETADGKILTPFLFLDIAIKAKLYPEITKTVIDKSFEYFRDKEFAFSINLSIQDIQNSEIVNFIQDRLSNYDASRVTFELLESEKVDNYVEVKEFIRSIKRFGCKIAIDDFGSGYSNFSHILELKVDYLKIDASLVKFVTTDNSSRVIVKTIINFATSLGLKTIAEFVEDQDSLEMLEKMGVDYVQGYYIGKPQRDI